MEPELGYTECDGGYDRDIRSIILEGYVAVYSQRVVAFIDILGFKSALKDAAKAKGILDALYNIKKKIEEDYSSPERFAFKGVLDIELTAFSDSIVISGDESQAIVVVYAALDFSRLLIERGFLCRGSIVYGDLYHKSDIVFGSGLVDAYESEASCAFYPRIILDESVVGFIEESNNNPSKPDELIVFDKDGCVFLNILYGVVDKHRLRAALCSLVKGGIERCGKNKSVVQKLVWVNNQYC